MYYECTSPTPWAIICPTHSIVYISRDEYNNQLSFPSSRWKCPICFAISWFDDDNYEARITDFYLKEPYDVICPGCLTEHSIGGYCDICNKLFLADIELTPPLDYNIDERLHTSATS